VKENVKIMSEFRIEGDKSILDFSAKMKQIEQDSLKLYEQTKKNILKEYNDNINKENEKRDAFEKKINDRISSQLHSYDNNINDLKERCTQLKKMLDNDYAVGKNTLGINSLKFDEIYTNKFNNLNKDIQDNNKKLREELEKKVNSLRNYIKKSMDDYSVHVDNDLYKKFEVLSGDFKDKIDKSKIELDGKMQQYFVECELRLKKQYEEFISKKK
jgi:exonuclease VII large subunit